MLKLPEENPRETDPILDLVFTTYGDGEGVLLIMLKNTSSGNLISWSSNLGFSKCGGVNRRHRLMLSEDDASLYVRND